MKKNKLYIGIILVVGILTGMGLYTRSNNKEYRAFIPNATEGTIAVVDIQTNELLEKINVGDTVSHGIAVALDGSKIYTGNLEDGDVLIFDMTKKEVIKSLDTGRNLHGIDITPDGRYVFITSGWTDKKEEYNYISIIDTQTDEIIKTIRSEESSPAHIDFSKDSQYAFVTNVMGNSVSILDIEKGEIEEVVQVGVMPNESELSPDGKFLYVANVQEGTLSIIDVKKREEVAKIQAGQGTHGVAVSRDGKYVWTTNRFSKDVSVIDIKEKKVIKTIKLNGQANHISIAPDKDVAYVSNMESQDIAVIDMNSYEVVNTIDVGSEPHEIDFIKTN